MTRRPKDTENLGADAAHLEAATFEPRHDSTTWFLATISLSLLCIYLAILNIQGWLQLEAVCEVAMSKDALTLCLQYGAR
jgi:hypothetical protein